jgi:ABC-type transport system involved in cytochrome c biogenesis permease component
MSTSPSPCFSARKPSPGRIWYLLVQKDISLMLFSREGATGLVTLSLMNAIILAIGTTSAMLPREQLLRIAPALLVASFIFSILSFVEHGCAADYRERAIDALRVMGIPPASLFLAKVCAISLFIAGGAMVSGLTLSLLLDLSLLKEWDQLFVCASLLSIGFSSLLVLLSTITINARLQGIILPLLAIPLSFPLTLSGIELTLESLVGGGIWQSPWLPLLIIADVVYLVGGFNLFESAVKS